MLLPKRKKCSTCNKKLPATTEYFYKYKSKDGLMGQCKECKRAYSKKQNNLVNTDPNITKVCSKCKIKKPATIEFFAKSKSGKYGVSSYCKECKHKQDKEYNINNKEIRTKYYETHKEEIKKYQQTEKYKEIKKKSDAKYAKNNPDKIFNKISKRRFKEENQGEGITKEQWTEMMQFFNWCCAYSGEYLGNDKNKDIRSIDHIIPLAKGGEHEIWNCVPMLRNLNSSKNDNIISEWYIKQEFYLEERLNKIYEWQEYAYEKWGSNK
ncbi:MAG: HNH endonuclease [Bacilli bacterium]